MLKPAVFLESPLTEVKEDSCLMFYSRTPYQSVFRVQVLARDRYNNTRQLINECNDTYVHRMDEWFGMKVDIDSGNYSVLLMAYKDDYGYTSYYTNFLNLYIDDVSVHAGTCDNVGK